MDINESISVFHVHLKREIGMSAELNVILSARNLLGLSVSINCPSSIAPSY